jgi:hypothetical protein
VLRKSNADPLRCAAAVLAHPATREAASCLSLRTGCLGAEPALDAAGGRFADTDQRARLNQLAGGLALCVLPSKNGNRGDSTERAAHGPGLAAGAGFRGAPARSLEKAGADIKLVTVATLLSIRRQRRRTADGAGRARRRHGAAIGAALRIQA